MVRFVLLLALLFALPARATCSGDCNADGAVDIGELIRGVNIALGNAPASQCPAMDANRSGSVSISELIAAVNVALAGCPVETPTPVPTATPTGGVDPIFPADYRDTFVEVRDCRLSVEHGGVSIRVLANPIAAEPYLRDANPLPVGSIVVKEEYEGSDCANDGDLARWRAMRKEAPGFDPDAGDWHWQWVDAPSRRVRFDDKRTCIGCHERQACAARDFMCTVGQTRGRLRPVLEALPAALLSVSGTGPRDVYAVGADPKDGRGPLVLHYDGSGWERLDSGASGDLWWISIAPIGGDFYLAGDGGLILQYHPETGRFTRHATPGTARLFGIWGAAANDLWAVGADPDNPDTGGVLWRFEGTDWRAIDPSSVRPGGLPQLFKVWGRASDDVYAVGFRGVVLHWNGSAWSVVDSAAANPRNRQLFTVNGTASLTAIVGGFFAEGLVLERGAGGAVTAATPAGIPQLNGVFFPPGGLGVAVGNGLAVATRDENGWTTVDEGTDDQGRDFHAVWVDSEDGIWAVGGDLADLVNGVLRYGGPQVPSRERR
ncbi:MAG: cytochrome P460 family protein [Candidatus Binatia bacterium]